MPFIGLIITIIATILIAPSDSDWVFNLSGGSRTASLVLLAIFWVIDIFFIIRWFNRRSQQNSSYQPVAPARKQIEHDPERDKEFADYRLDFLNWEKENLEYVRKIDRGERASKVKAKRLAKENELLLIRHNT